MNAGSRPERATTRLPRAGVEAVDWLAPFAPTRAARRGIRERWSRTAGPVTPKSRVLVDVYPPEEGATVDSG